MLSTILAVISAARTIWSMVKEGIALAWTIFAKQADTKLRRDLQEAKDATTVEDKAAAACKIQKDIDPSATCDDGSGSK